MDNLRRNKAVAITGFILLIIALIVFLINLIINDFNFVAFFKSTTFVWICVIIGLYAIGVAVIFILVTS